MPILAGILSFLAPVQISAVIIIVIIGFCAMPLFASGARRLQDTGEDGRDAYAPWFLAAVSFLFGNWAYRSISHFNDAFASQYPPDGPWGLGFAIQYGLGGLLLWIICAICAAMFLFLIVPAVGQTLLPSQPDSNKHGPNPTEVNT